MADDELAMLATLAEADGVTSSDYVRLFIRKQYAMHVGDKKPRTRHT
jgi:hypothetical protein